MSGAWTLSGISPALASSDTITADATATGESTSDTDCNLFVVGSECSAPPISAFHCGKSIQGLTTPGALVNVYQGNSTVPSVPTSGTIFAVGTPNTITADNLPSPLTPATDNFVWKCVGTGPSVGCNASGPACLVDGAYRITATEPGKCESPPLWICIGGVAPTADPSISTSPVTTATTSISGSVAAPDNVAGVDVYLYAGSVEIGSTTTAAGGTWTISGLSINACDTISALAVHNAANLCPSNYTTGIPVSGGVSAAPVILGDYCTSSTVSEVIGTSSEAVGSTIYLFENAVLIDSTTVLTGGVWTITGLSISVGSSITATCLDGATCGLESASSNAVVVELASSNACLLYTSDAADE